MNETLNDPLPSFGGYEQVSVPSVHFAPGGASEVVRSLVNSLRSPTNSGDSPLIFCIDAFFQANETAATLGATSRDVVLSVDTKHEPTNLVVDGLTRYISERTNSSSGCVIGFGGGITLDTAKAISNLLTNPGPASKYQGWDLVSEPAVHKIGVPTISGTGAEASRTCVITDAKTGAKLGMNSKYSVFDTVVLDPQITRTVPREQYFYTGMDTFMHCFESLNGRYRNPIADAYARESMRLIKTVFDSPDMMSDESRTNLMIASFLGGTAIAGGYVGLVHPMSAALSVVLGTHHGLANCIVMRAMEPYYPHEYQEFWGMAAKQQVNIPTIDGAALSDEQLNRLVDSTLIHERPLSNALGLGFREILSRDVLKSLFAKL